MERKGKLIARWCRIEVQPTLTDVTAEGVKATISLQRCIIAAVPLMHLRSNRRWSIARLQSLAKEKFCMTG